GRRAAFPPSVDPMRLRKLVVLVDLGLDGEALDAVIRVTVRVPVDVLAHLATAAPFTARVPIVVAVAAVIAVVVLKIKHWCNPSIRAPEVARHQYAGGSPAL